MTVTTQRIDHTPLVGAGLSIPTANKKRSVARWVEAKENRTDNWTKWATRSSDEKDQIEIESGQSYAPFITTTIGTQTTNNSQNIVVASTALLRVGDQLKIEDFYSGSTTEYDDTLSERLTILSITNGTTFVADRHEGELTSGNWFVHPVSSKVTVVARAQNYNEPFPDAITFRGDLIVNHAQRLDSGEVTYDLAAVQTPDFEAPGGHYMRDIMYWKNELPNYRNDVFINGRKRTGDYTATPKIPYRLGGAIWSAEQVGANVVPITGQLNPFDFSDIFEDLATNHTDGPGDTIWMAPRMVSIWSEMMLPYKGMFGGAENTLNMATNLTTYFGKVSQNGLKHDNRWPPSKILITSKADWEWGNFKNMDWTYVERGPEELGAFQQSWTMGGDFWQLCKNYTHQRLLTAIDIRKDLYPARTNFL